MKYHDYQLIYQWISKIALRLFLKVIRLYQRWLSPLLPARCRYYPTCSHYGQLALQWHGAWRGGLLICTRIARCHPWGGHGVDFVPLPLYQYQYVYIARETQIKGVFIDSNSYVTRLNHMLKSGI
ncbi:membrane protein insertion efficiency factor YidD [Psychrobacter sp. I-STPA6b]|uniref:membrane protein insertion efficiency factor YidD n=1 Tax=Psychrobacter sp. I-STPA6b TaxID=2585718 RepID=UPI001D0C195A|nr:membrane protein insertion efficiency factor YidD [Psychrobacter sp. I-STPA6b]